MKNRWHKSRYMMLGILSLNLLVGATAAYGEEVNSPKVEVAQETREGELAREKQLTSGGQVAAEIQYRAESQAEGEDQVSKASRSTQEENQSIPNMQREQRKQDDVSSENRQGGQGGKGGRQQEASNPIQVCLTLVALFGIGSFAAVLSSVLYKLYVLKKVVVLPVLYYGNGGEGLHEQ